ncbi:hypothetical protein QTP88_015948 [Uroleucon formosanum]
MLCEVYGEECLSRARVFEWHKRFCSGREDVEDDDRSGRPTSSTNENVEKIDKIIRQDRRLSVRAVTEMVNIDRESVRKILVENLNMKKVCAKMVPKNLTIDQKFNRKEICSDTLKIIKDDPSFINNIITCDETWIFTYDPETKSQSMHWKTPTSPRMKKARMSKSKFKAMLIVFFDIKGIIFVEWVPSGQTVNQYYCKEVLIKLRERVRKKRPDLWKNGWVLHQDNAPAHSAFSIQRFLTEKKISVLQHPPYSPDLAPCDFFLFPKIKCFLKGTHFQTVDDVKMKTEKLLKGLNESDRQHCFQEWQRRMQQCIDAEGSNERDDGHLEFLNNVTSVTVHVECRKVYTHKKKIASFKREREENAAGPSNPSPHKKRSSKFDFRTLCLVCGEEANEDVEKRKRQEYRRKIKQVSTLSFKDNIIKTAESHDDRLGKIVRDRINFEYDLVAAEAKYHDNCLISFNKYKSGGSVGRPHDENIRLAMEEIFYYIENNNDCQFTLTELVNAITSDFIPDAKTIIYKLTARYGKDIIITTKHAKLTIICFLDTQKKILCQSWYENKKSNVLEERLRVVEAAAAIIRVDIRSVLINTDTYPPVNQMFDNINKNIPQSLLFFLKQIIIRNKKGNINELENKCTALSHAIMKCTRPRSFLSRLLLGISVFLHRRYGSKCLLDMLSNLGFSNTYKEVLLYESAVVNTFNAGDDA